MSFSAVSHICSCNWTGFHYIKWVHFFSNEKFCTLAVLGTHKMIWCTCQLQSNSTVSKPDASAIRWNMVWMPAQHGGHCDKSLSKDWKVVLIATFNSFCDIACLKFKFLHNATAGYFQSRPVSYHKLGCLERALASNSNALSLRSYSSRWRKDATRLPVVVSVCIRFRADLYLASVLSN